MATTQLLVFRKIIESKSLVDNTSFLIGIKNTAIKIKNSI